MASSYTTGFSLEKIATGEQSGTWGTTSNHNWDIVDRLASYKAVALSDASTATLTIREASPGSGTENLQDGMYRTIKFTGSLSQDCTVTIAPNTAPAWFIIENAAGDDVILSQGSGANVTVQNGKNVIVYCDGAGSGAAVVDALADLQVGTLEVTGAAAIDGAATFSSTVTVDDVAVNGKVITMTGSSSDTAVFTAGTNGTLSIVTTDAAAAAANIQITADGTVDIDSAGVLTLDSGAAINIEPASGSAILLDGTISIDAGVVTGATSITSTAFVGDITGDVTGNTSGTAATVTTAAQSSITSLGTLTTLTVDSIIINGTNIGHTSDTDAIAISSGGVVTMNQIPVFSAGINVSGGTIAGTLATAAQGNVTSLGTLSALIVTGQYTLASIQTFTSTGTWTKPSGVRFVRVQVLGGGGGGGGATASGTTTGAGAGGGYAEEWIDVTGTSSETATVGAGGTGATSVATGGTGGTSSFGSLTSATGGAGGGAGLAWGAAGGAGSGGSFNITGGHGAPGVTTSAATTGVGGGSFFGNGGGNAIVAGDGQNGAALGSGGGGAFCDGSQRDGGNGAAGIVIVWEYK